MTSRFELTFVGGAPIKYRRMHETYDIALTEIYRVFKWMDLEGHPSAMDDSRLNRSAHPAIIYGPGCGHNGVTHR